MEERRVVADNLNLRVEEDEDDFRSCCQDEDELKENEEHAKIESDENLDELFVKLYFKGVSITSPGDYGSRISGIGVVIENPGRSSPIRVQKKLDFHVDELVAEYLALLDGLSVAIQHDMRRVFAFTNSEALHNQIACDEVVESPILEALRQRILELASNFETFVLKLAPLNDIEKALSLARVAVGIIASHSERNESTEICSICCQEKLSPTILNLKCSHKFCSHCLKTFVERKTQLSEFPIKCPQRECNYRISPAECILFLPVASYESFERANIANSSEIPFSDDEYREEIEAYPGQELEQWAWDSFESLPMMDVYSDQERSQLALIQRFLSGGLSFYERNSPPPPPPPPRCTNSYAEVMKDLHQLPWLERFVSVISDSYYEEYIQ